MDVKCLHCGEPWDHSCLNLNTRPCDFDDYYYGKRPELRGQGRLTCVDGKVTGDYVATEAGGEIRIECAGNWHVDSCHADGCDDGKIPCPADDCNEGDSHSGEAGNCCTTCEGFETLDCPECCGKGYREERCDICTEVIEELGDYGRTFAIGDGELYHTSCAAERGYLTDEHDCPECNGTGKLEQETDIGTHADIKRFLAGEGCPCCDFGAKELCKCSDCEKLEYGYPGSPCWDARVLKNCTGRLAAFASPEDDERRERSRVLRELLGGDLDGLASQESD